jgi:hypothetical protein
VYLGTDYNGMYDGGRGGAVQGAAKESAFLGVRLADGLKLETSALGLRTKVLTHSVLVVVLQLFCLFSMLASKSVSPSVAVSFSVLCNELASSCSVVPIVTELASAEFPWFTMLVQVDCSHVSFDNYNGC